MFFPVSDRMPVLAYNSLPAVTRTEHTFGGLDRAVDSTLVAALIQNICRV